MTDPAPIRWPDAASGAGRGRLAQVSRRVGQVEAAVAAALVAAIFLLLLGGAAGRALGWPLLWADEVAVHLMVWIAFLGASIGLAARDHMRVSLLPDRLSPAARLRLALATDALVLLLLAVLAWLVWRWFDLPGLWRAGSGEALARDTFNFVYTDPMLTLGLRKLWFWLILPWTCAAGLLHAAAALAEDLAQLRAAA